MLCMEPQPVLVFYQLGASDGLMDSLFQAEGADSAHFDGLSIVQNCNSFQHGDGLSEVLLGGI